MALADVQQIVNSYISGIQNKLAQQKQDQEAQYQKADVDLRTKQLQEDHDFHTAQTKAALAIQQAQHLKSLQDIQNSGQTPVGSTFTGASVPGDTSDENTPVTNTYDAPDPFSQTGRSNINILSPTTVAQQAADFNRTTNQPAEERKIAEYRAQQDAETDRQIKIGAQNNQYQLNLEAMRTHSDAAIHAADRASAERVATAGRTSQREQALISQGFIPPTANTTSGLPNQPSQPNGGQGVDINASGVPELLNSLRTGQHTATDMGQYQGPGKMALRMFAQEGGIPINQKQQDNLKGIQNVLNLLPEYQKIVNELPDTTTIPGAFVRNKIQHVTNPELVNNLQMLNSQALTAGRAIAGESGRPTNLQTQLINGGLFPSLDGTPKVQQQERLVRLHKTAIDEANTTLSNIPKGDKRNMILRGLGLLDQDAVMKDDIPAGLELLVPEGKTVTGPSGASYKKIGGKLVRVQ